MPSGAHPITPDMTLRQLTEWAQGQRDRCAAQFGVTDDRRNEFLLMQAVKLNEEAGELFAEILAQTGYQRLEKMARYSDETLANEIADVAVCVAILADSCGVDLGKALAQKIYTIEQRWTG